MWIEGKHCIALIKMEIKKYKVEIFGISQQGTQDTGEDGQDHAHHTAGQDMDSKAMPRGAACRLSLFISQDPGNPCRAAGSVLGSGPSPGLYVRPEGSPEGVSRSV